MVDDVNWEQCLSEIRHLREDVAQNNGRTIKITSELASVRTEVSAVKDDVSQIKLRLEGDDGEGGMCARVHSLEMSAARNAGLQNGNVKGQTFGMRLGLIIGILLAGAGARDVVQSFVMAIIGGN